MQESILWLHGKKGKDFQDADEWRIWNSRWSFYIEYNLRIIGIVLDIVFDILQRKSVQNLYHSLMASKNVHVYI